MKNKNDKSQNDPSITHEDFVSIGAFLRGQREKKGHSLKFVSEKTRISSTKLELLEKDELNQLPNKAYVTGFVKAYSKYLNLKSEDALHCLKETYERLYPDSTNTKIKVLTPNDDINRRPLGAIFIVGSIFALLLTGVYFFMKSKSQDKIRAELRTPIQPQVLTSKSPLRKKLKEKEVSENIKRIPVATAESLNAKGETPVVAVAPVKDEVQKPTEVAVKVVVKEPIKEPVLVAVKEPIKVPVTEPVKIIAPPKVEKPVEKVEAKIVLKKENGENEGEKKLRFFSIPGPLYSFDKKNSKTLVKKYLPIDIKMSAAEGKENVYIRAIEGDSWITYKKDNGPVRKFVLRKGRNLFISGKEVRVFLGNLPAIKVFYNNKALKIDSKSGVKSLVFPHKNMTKFKLPLFVFHKDGTVTTSEEYLKENPEL